VRLLTPPTMKFSGGSNQKESEMKIKNNNKGITILEIMIMLVILGITTTLAVPRFGQVIDKLKLKTTARDMVSSLRLARSHAVSQRSQFGVYFDLESNQYVLFKDLANPGSFTYDAGSDSDMVTTSLPGNTSFGWSSFPNFTVIFKPDGSASSSGLVELHSVSEEEGYSGYFTVDVLGSTGRVKLISGHTFE
jgi:Tfp pilus assembly protein FimT